MILVLSRSGRKKNEPIIHNPELQQLLCRRTDVETSICQCFLSRTYCRRTDVETSDCMKKLVDGHLAKHPTQHTNP
jgi:hypothetical protein